MALAAYRSLFRATRIAFQGDQATLLGARNRIRDEFRSHSSSNPADPESQKRIAHAQEVASFLRANVVQGVREGEGNFRLNIHEETERGDNDTIMQPKSASSGGGCGGCK